MSIITSTNQRKAAKRIQRALQKDPNDIRSLLQWSTMLDARKKKDLDQKRRLLHRVLSLEPGHRQARQMLLEMDRAEIGGDPSRLSLAVILADPSSDVTPQQPLVLKYSIVHQILVYVFLTTTVFAALRYIRDAWLLAGVGVFLLLSLWVISAVIEIRDSGLHMSRLLGLIRLELPWHEIREVKPAWGHGIRIINCAGKAAVISSHIQGYPFIPDILCQMRPDLFERTENPGNGTQDTSAIVPLR